jgi:hypothetical protein
MRGTINICQPGYGASCRLLRQPQYRGSRASMLVEFARRAALFGARGAETEGAMVRPPMPMPAEHPSAPLSTTRDRYPLAGFIDADRTLVGCLAYSRPPASDAARGIFERTCRTNSCPARETQDDSERFRRAPDGRLVLLRPSHQLHTPAPGRIHTHFVPENEPERRLRAVENGSRR